MVVYDEDPVFVATDPGAAIGEELDESERPEEDVEAALPNASAIAAAWHIANDAEEIVLTVAVACRVAVGVCG